ncbi:type II toxin-antitoxin system RelE/ParE family toxin [Myroides albus]|uniref:Type II toxin-antitoxin system RelE/ParE family toxin n=1 Tax=Myroides albus TaxID=2562892 RepID=A0A6I3LMJ2_9FLAO|nr:type II toxin-antitoxin system RelE/ParE family toxin [Myroides albus]MTG98927.1 type II toxin-antitoxin system RelE/ParE family toxin [Myroides albus]UVD80016.1 type II toxin-antitoxin system RelE/ParE family toxin [Myroides albus]
MNSIVWSQTAQDDYWDNIDFLLRRWTKRESIRFINAVEKTIELLKQGQVTFKSTGYKNTYQITIVKQITLYYIFIEDNKIVLLRFFNNHQNTNKLSL